MNCQLRLGGDLRSQLNKQKKTDDNKADDNKDKKITNGELIAYLKDNQLTLSSAGMPPYFIYRANSQSTEEIMLSGIPLGSFKNVEFDQLTTEFNKGDILAIISDGLAEAPNASGALFDYPQIQSIITANSHMNAENLIKELMRQADIWLAGANNPDDITIVIIKHN